MIDVRVDLPKKEPADENDPLNGQASLTWRPFGKRAIFVCPNGHDGLLADHHVAADGAVSPSVVCPYDGCDFHDYIRLVSWAEFSGAASDKASKDES